MTRNRRNYRISLSLAILAMLLLGAVSGQAQRRDRDDERTVWQIAERNGYEYGLRDGREDWRLGSSFDHKRGRAWRDGRWGYRPEYRHRNAYRDGFREGYQDGYRQGYRQSGRRGGWDRGRRRW